MPRVEDTTDYVVRDSSSGPGEQPQRVARAKPAKVLTPTLTAAMNEWTRRHDRSIGYVSRALAYGFRYMQPSMHSSMVRLIKGGHLRVCRVHGKPPPGSNAYRDSPYGDSYYIIRPECPPEVPEGTLYGKRRRRRK